MRMLETKGFVAFLTIKMHVKVFYRTSTFIGANGIFHRSRTIVYTVNKAMSQKQGYRSENSGFVYRIKPILQIEQRNGLLKFHHRL
jgi:hypothetical protein